MKPAAPVTTVSPLSRSRFFDMPEVAFSNGCRIQRVRAWNPHESLEGGQLLENRNPGLEDNAWEQRD
jgi:hypothetical protein